MGIVEVKAIGTTVYVTGNVRMRATFVIRSSREKSLTRAGSTVAEGRGVVKGQVLAAMG